MRIAQYNCCTKLSFAKQHGKIPRNMYIDGLIRNSSKEPLKLFDHHISLSREDLSCLSKIYTSCDFINKMHNHSITGEKELLVL